MDYPGNPELTAPLLNIPAQLPPGSVSWLEIDLAALKDNLRAFHSLLKPPAQLVAVVKGDAYGHGLPLVAPAALEAGAEWLAVGTLGEGIALRRQLGPDVPVLVLNHIPPRDAEEVVRQDLRVTVYTRATLEALGEAARRLGRPAQVHLKLETGTQRQGVVLEDALDLARRAAALPGVDLEGLSTHFADIEDTTDHVFAEQQLERFREGVRALEEAGTRPRLLHTACSAASILFPETHFDLARVGIGMYGLWPSRETLVSARERGIRGFQLKPVMSWKCLVAQVRDVPPGSFVGYGRTWRATRPSRIAVLPVGYYEGYPRALSGRSHVLFRGRRAEVVGRICMNMTMVDVTDIPGVEAGEVAVLFGASGEERIRAEDLANWAGTIHYEIISRIHPSLPRLPV